MIQGYLKAVLSDNWWTTEHQYVNGLWYILKDNLHAVKFILQFQGLFDFQSSAGF